MNRIIGFAVVVLLAGLARGADTEDSCDYGVDCSFPIHYLEQRCDCLGDRKQFYEDYMQGCRDYYGKKAKACDSTEKDRLEMSLGQPQSMVNYTSTGFKKIRAPDDVMKLLYSHWETNKNAKEKEVWSTGNIYVNHWESPTYMVSVENPKLKGGGYKLKSMIWNAVKTEIEKWTGMEQKETSMYGIRIYTEGAVLSPHVDRLPLVSSCIINVAQDVDEPWPLEVIDREGKAVNVTMKPGDMVLYESGSLIHARPFPLKGRFMANIFIHFEPTGRRMDDDSYDYLDELDDFYPPYLQIESPWADHWARQNPSGWKKQSPSAPKQHSNIREPHVAASIGDVERLKELAEKNKQALHRPDENGWHPIHEAVRSGHLDATKLLIEHGADVNVRTGVAKNGQSVLNLALEYHSKKSPIVQYLVSMDAEDIDFEEL